MRYELSSDVEGVFCRALYHEMYCLAQLFKTTAYLGSEYIRVEAETEYNDKIEFKVDRLKNDFYINTQGYYACLDSDMISIISRIRDILVTKESIQSGNRSLYDVNEGVIKND